MTYRTSSCYRNSDVYRALRVAGFIVVKTATGVRGAKRTEAQLASREKYRKAGRMFASQMTAAGMALDSDEGWAR